MTTNEKKAAGDRTPDASTSTSEMTTEEITYARAADKLCVDADGLGSVPTAWLREWRSRVRRTADAQTDIVLADTDEYRKHAERETASATPEPVALDRDDVTRVAIGSRGASPGEARWLAQALGNEWASASAQSGLDPEHCETCAAFVERNAPPAPKVEVKSELWDAAKLKMRQLEGEIQRCSATQREKSNMLHSFSKLCMFATDAWDMEVTRPANRRPSKAPPGLREAAEEVFAAFNTPGITDAQASSLVHLGAVLERRSEGAQSEPPWCKGCRAQRTTSSDGYCINCGTKEEPASVCAHGVTLASPCMTCIRYGADDPRGPDHGRPTPNAGKDGAK